MRNIVGPGRIVDVAAMPYASTTGQGVLVGTALFGVSVDTYASGAAGELAVEGIFDITKSTTYAFAAGGRAFWDNSAKVLTTSSTSNQQVAVVITAALTTDATVRAKIVASLPAAT